MAAEDPKVLIVDDQPRNLDALEAMLAPLRSTLIRAQSADEALLCLLKHDFAAIVLDIHMPGMSGIELANQPKSVAVFDLDGEQSLRCRNQCLPALFGIK